MAEATGERQPVMEAELWLSDDGEDYSGNLRGIVPGEYITDDEFAICSEMVLAILAADRQPRRIMVRVWLHPRAGAAQVKLFRRMARVEDAMISNVTFHNRGLIRIGDRWRMVDSAFYAADRAMAHVANMPDVVRDSRNRPMFWLEIEPIGKEQADG